MAIGKTKKTAFQQEIYGSWGRFKTPSGVIEFLETKARIGASAKDNEKRLANYLLPVREILNASTMDFNQLLQRDLDDHRVSTFLVPYVLNTSKVGPAFFPPIVVALLPFSGTEPKSSFAGKCIIPKDNDDIGSWRGYRFGEAFKFEAFLDADENEYHEIKIGRLSWNPEEAKLVVIDGQHRAMALLAIDRTINNTWSERGEKYRYFYEPVINNILKQKTEAERHDLFSNFEFPVTILWFPDVSEGGLDHHSAARKLFVDVNQNARQPSESRILLLSDDNLLSLFTRRVLNEFRNTDDTLPIFAIEYDHPGKDQASSAKWSVISNVIILRDCINRSVFGPSKLIKNLDFGFSGRESETDRSYVMRTSLQIDEEIGEREEGIERDKIDNCRFPFSKKHFFENQLMRGWGYFVVQALSRVVPYKIHGQALNKLKDGWATAGTTDALAKDAIFEGVGMYWTVRDSFLHWQELNKDLTPDDQIPKNDVVQTWLALELKEKQFYLERCELYLGKSDSASLALSKEAFNVFSTNACQLGLVITARTLVDRAGICLEDLKSFSDKFIEACNNALESAQTKTHPRKLFLCKSHTDSLNRIAKLDTPYAVYFRYFWLELLGLDIALNILKDVVDPSIVITARNEARLFYYKYLVRENLKILKRTEIPSTVADNEDNSGADDVAAESTVAAAPKKIDIEKEASELSYKTLSLALSKWFGIKKSELIEFKKQIKTSFKKPDIDNTSSQQINDSGCEVPDGESLPDSSGESFEDLLAMKTSD